VVHFEIQADDLDRAQRFYTTVFGWTVMPWSVSADYRLLTTGPDGEPGINGAVTTRSGPPAGESIAAWVCTVEVTDLAQTERAVVAGGGRQVRDRGAVPGVGVVSYFTDTEGNMFAALQPEPAPG
jgi:predicted enzyme related to lactoylglutathione lyase